MGQLDEIIGENRDTLSRFAERFLEKLGDEELIDELARRDLEKLARVFKLVCEQLATEEKKPSAALTAIIGAVGKIDPEGGGQDGDN